MSAEFVKDLSEKIKAAGAAKRPLRLRGAGTKDFYGGALQGDVLDCGGYAGIVAYEPTELVITARCGTTLAEVEKILDAEGQLLAFEPPHFGPGATPAAASRRGCRGRGARRRARCAISCSARACSTAAGATSCSAGR